MGDPVQALVLDLLEWIGAGPRPYAQVLDVWRTSCPRLPVWEEATERGLVERSEVPGGAALVRLTAAGVAFLERHRSESLPGVDLAREVGRLLHERRGHFLLESGHHGDLWLDLELLFLHPAEVRPLAAALAARVARHGVEAVCAPLVEGAFVGLSIASALDVPFAYAERVAKPAARGLFPFAYRIPEALRPHLRGKRVAVVNDVTNAGSAVRGALDDLAACGATPVAIATLATLGDASQALAAERGVALETLAAFPNRLFEPASCPLCAQGTPLTER